MQRQASPITDSVKPLDSHALVASPDRASYPRAPDAPPPEAEPSCEQLMARLARCGGEGAILVQRSRSYGYDNRYILDAATCYPQHVRAVAMVDSLAPDSAAKAAAMLERREVAALRLMEPVQGAPLDWLDGPLAQAQWRLLAERGGVMQIHLFPWARAEGLARLSRLCIRYPDVTLVLDNLTNIDLTAPDFGMDNAFLAWADNPAVHFRFTTLALARCVAAGIPPAQAIAAVAARFGAERLLWGSDIVPTGMRYGEAVKLGLAAVADLSGTAQRDVLHANARRLFFCEAQTASSPSVTGVPA